MIFLILASLNLGLFRTPSTYLNIKGFRDIRLNFESKGTISSLFLLVSSDLGMGLKVSPGRNETSGNNFTRYESGYYIWRQLAVGVEADSLVLSLEGLDLKIYEIAAMGPSRERLTIESANLEGSNSSEAQKLFDEQEFFDVPPTFISQMYFDEVYFVKAARDYLDLREPSEWTHPPLGKLIIASGITLFSYSPFGWRIAGVLFATLMIPVIYLLSKRVFKSTFAAVISSVLLTFDFMHFTMARIGTVDTYLVFFSMVSALFFYMNFESLTSTGKPAYRFIFLGILFFSIAFAVKWTAVYGFVGQIALMIAVGLRNFRRTNHGLVNAVRSVSRPLAIIAASLAIGGLVYVSTYIPYMFIGHNLADVYQLQWTMFNFHAGLTAGHPFASEWWTWPFMFRPLWVFTTQVYEGVVSTITAMGNPMIWWFGFPSVSLALWRGLKKGNMPYLYVSVLFLFQWLANALIPRALFIYHYYPAVPMMILASAGILSGSWSDPKERRFIVIYLIAVVAFFIAFYPVISGYPVPVWYKDSLKWSRGWPF